MVKGSSPSPGRASHRDRGNHGPLAVFVVAISTAFLSISLFSSAASTFSLIEFMSPETTFAANNNTASERNLHGDGSSKDKLLKILQNDPAFEMNQIAAPDYHFVVSTGCSTYQDWQSYALFFHSKKSGQVSEDGPSVSYVTRVVSGCNEEQARKMKEIHEKEIAPMAPGRFFIHFTPSYQLVKPGVSYHFFNKPYGYKHWMENALRYPYNHERYDNVTYILLDPDQIIIRPFSNDFGNMTEMWGGPFTDKRTVERGIAFAQEYAFGVNFFWSLDMGKIAPKDEVPSPLSGQKPEDLYQYMVGPPYIMKGFDLWRVISKWADFAPYVHDQLPEHLAEMYAYSTAAAHLGLRHQVAHSFMVSNADVIKGEGWGLMDNKPAADVCGNIPLQDLPHVLHYCQEYGIGKYFFSKYLLRSDFLSCEAPLLKEPPRNLGALHNYMINPRDQKRLDFKDIVARRNAFAVCFLVKAMNEAAEYYKRHHCDQSKANYNRTLAHFEDMTTEQKDAT